MNTKSFVNGLDPENTVKGYYDENDQLVMVEPEGSGGGSWDVIIESDLTFTYEDNAASAAVELPELQPEYVYVLTLEEFKSVTVVLMLGADMISAPNTTVLGFNNEYGWDVSSLKNAQNDGSLSVYSNEATGSASSTALSSWASGGAKHVEVKRIHI